MRQWRACGVLSAAVIVGIVALYLGVKLLHRHAADGGHAHQASPHGGVVVSTGDDDGHYHLEALVGQGSILKLYTYAEDVEELLKVESQILTAHVKPEGGAETTPVVLMPMPQSGDGEGKTSRFFGKLPKELRGKALSVHVPGIDLAGRRFPLDFTVAVPEGHGGGRADRGEEEEKLLLSAGGKYTEADIQANGGTTASRRYKGIQASHDARPRLGEKLCPVSLTKANREFAWVVGGKTYVFCCPPCVEEFVRRAKEQPQLIKEPEAYVKK
jgi:hypothetical protein